jgi:hypothetical protein
MRKARSLPLAPSPYAGFFNGLDPFCDDDVVGKTKHYPQRQRGGWWPSDGRGGDDRRVAAPGAARGAQAILPTLAGFRLYGAHVQKLGTSFTQMESQRVSQQ